MKTTNSINNYKDGNRHGYWEYHHDNGKIRSKGDYKDGKWVER